MVSCRCLPILIIDEYLYSIPGESVSSRSDSRESALIRGKYDPRLVNDVTLRSTKRFQSLPDGHDERYRARWHLAPDGRGRIRFHSGNVWLRKKHAAQYGWRP